jgi:hypothetical protein
VRGSFRQGLREVCGVVEVGEGVDVLVEAIEPAWQVVAGVELVSPGALGGFDGSVEVGPLWGQDEEGEVLTARLERVCGLA